MPAHHRQRRLAVKIALGLAGLGAASWVALACSDDPHRRTTAEQARGGGGACAALPGELPSPTCDSSENQCVPPPRLRDRRGALRLEVDVPAHRRQQGQGRAGLPHPPPQDRDARDARRRADPEHGRHAQHRPRREELRRARQGPLHLAPAGRPEEQHARHRRRAPADGRDRPGLLLRALRPRRNEGRADHDEDRVRGRHVQVARAAEGEDPDLPQPGRQQRRSSFRSRTSGSKASRSPTTATASGTSTTSRSTSSASTTRSARSGRPPARSAATSRSRRRTQVKIRDLNNKSLCAFLAGEADDLRARRRRQDPLQGRLLLDRQEAR